MSSSNNNNNNNNEDEWSDFDGYVIGDTGLIQNTDDRLDYDDDDDVDTKDTTNTIKVSIWYNYIKKKLGVVLLLQRLHQVQKQQQQQQQRPVKLYVI